MATGHTRFVLTAPRVPQAVDHVEQYQTLMSGHYYWSTFQYGPSSEIAIIDARVSIEARDFQSEGCTGFNAL